MARGRRNEKANKKRGILRIAAYALALLVLTAIIATLAVNDGVLSIEGFKRTFSGLGGVTYADTLYFDADKGGEFCDVDGALLCAGTLGIQLIAENGDEIARETLSMARPAVSSNGSWAVAYDLGGTEVRVVDKGGIRSKQKVEGSIISASVSEDGYLAVCREEAGHKGLVSVYNDSGTELFRWYSADGYVMAASVAGDEKSLAVLTYREEGSRVTFFELGNKESIGEYTNQEELLLDITYLSSGKLLAVGESYVRQIDSGGGDTVLYDYGGRLFSGYSFSGSGAVAVYLRDYQIGSLGSIETFDLNGKPLGTLAVDRAVTSFSAAGSNVAVLSLDEVVLYTRAFEERGRFADMPGATSVIMRSGGDAVVTLLESAKHLDVKAAAE